MKFVSPQVFMIAETTTNYGGLYDMLMAIGATKYVEGVSTNGDGTALIEVAGRLCYKSFEVGLNPNVTKIREGNKEYISNILSSKHGSVLEHATVSIAFIDVSRIFTHEIVRHRAGTAFSQESMRYVRMQDIGMYMPKVFGESVNDIPENSGMNQVAMEGEFVAITHAFEHWYSQIWKGFEGIKSFGLKKRITSALRRLAPGGHSTNIIVTANHRAWRHIIEQRTSPGAEEEMVEAVFKVAILMQQHFPNIYQDLTIDEDTYVCSFTNSKV